MKCNKCGVELEPGALFCQDCGTPVRAGAASEPTAPLDTWAEKTQRFPEQATQAAQTEQSTAVMPPAMQATETGGGSFRPAQTPVGKKRISSRTIAIGVICVAAVIAVAFGAATALGLRGPFSPSPAPEAPTATASSSAASEDADESEDETNDEAEDDESAGSDKSSAASDSSEASSKAASEQSEEAPEGFNEAKAESQARSDAEHSGMQVFMGTVHITTYDQRAAAVDSKLSKSFQNLAGVELALLEFSIDEDVAAASAGNYYNIEKRSGQECIALANPWNWEQFDEQLVTVAAYPDDLVFPNDAAGRLYSAIGNVELIAPLDEVSAQNLAFVRQGPPELVYAPYIEPEPSKSSESAKSDESKRSAAAATSGDYVLPGSDSRQYTKAELSDLSDYELFLARNEIFARHGRIFQSDELQDYFESKSWYDGTVPAAQFTESVLNNTEIANADTIRAIEQERNSKYL